MWYCGFMDSTVFGNDATIGLVCPRTTLVETSQVPSRISVTITSVLVREKPPKSAMRGDDHEKRKARRVQALSTARCDHRSERMPCLVGLLMLVRAPATVGQETQFILDGRWDVSEIEDEAFREFRKQHGLAN